MAPTSGAGGVETLQRQSELQRRMDDEDSDDEPLLPAPQSWFHENNNDTGESSEEEARVEPLAASKSPSSTSTPPRPQKLSLASPLPAPSWQEISSHVLPTAAKELFTTSLQRIGYTARLVYTQSRLNYLQHSELASFTARGYDRHKLLGQSQSQSDQSLPPCSSLSWIERQMVLEWRMSGSEDGEDEFDRARKVVPAPLTRPMWERAEHCHYCGKPFGPTRYRHHCRHCGKSVCQTHGAYSHKLPQLGYYDLPERVCEECKLQLMEQNLAERVAWRYARCRDHYELGTLQPYFETGVDTLEEIVLRVTEAAIAMAKSIPLGAQATVAVETVDVLRKYGLNGIYTIMLRQEFLAAADLLRKALGINRTAWPLSVHELSAALFYALAQHRAMRGMNPEQEHILHALREIPNSKTERQVDEAVVYDEESNVSTLVNSPNEPTAKTLGEETVHLPYQPVCDPLPDSTLASLIFYAPMALNFVYATKAVDMQLLAAQQGWRLLYAYLDQDDGHKATDRPASALFVHEEQKIVCVAVRGTSTIQDVITDIRQVPVPFPEMEADVKTEEDWTTVFRGQGLAVCGMAGAAVNLYREHIDAILYFAKRGYRIRLTGHSLGGGVATLLGVLVYRDLEREDGEIPQTSGGCTSSRNDRVRVYSYGTPSCVDAQLADDLVSFVTTVVLHDDAIPRLTPTSCRGLLKHLLHIRETWVKDHLPDDLMAIKERARTVWAPRWRGSFTLSKSSSQIKRYCKRKLQDGKEKLLSVKEKLVGEECYAAHFSTGSPDAQDNVDDESEDCRVPSEQVTTKREQENVLYEDTPEPRPVIDYIGGIDGRGGEGILIDGDEFFDSTLKLLEGSDADSESDDDLDSALFHSTAELNQANRHATIQEAEAGHTAVETSVASSLSDEDDTPGAVVLEEIPLPRMYVPGKVVHIYSHRGVYRAAYVPRTFRELRRISLAGNMLSDHRTKEYYEALLEVSSVREAREYPPVWTAFDEDDTCSCCASRFTWASTSDSEAQEARDKHNCRSCGTLVCDPCSKNRIPLPSIGIYVPARVCDRCYNDVRGLLTKPGGMADSFIAGGDDSRRVNRADGDRQHSRLRDRRSIVVDELASRVQASAATFS